MEKKTKGVTIFNFVVSGILWLLGILTLLFNLLGLWAAWHLAGFGFVFYAPLALLVEIAVSIYTHRKWQEFLQDENRTRFFMNLISIGISILFILLTVFVSTTWFW